MFHEKNNRPFSPFIFSRYLRPANNHKKIRIDDEACLKGKVKQVKQDHYQAIEKMGGAVQGAKKDYFNTLYKFDNWGNEIEWIQYQSDGSVDFKDTCKYYYDSQGNWIKKILFRNDVP